MARKTVDDNPFAEQPREKLTITPPKYEYAIFTIRGSADYVQNKFGGKAGNELREKHAAGQQARSKVKKPPKDFEGLYRDALHKSEEGWYGIPAPAFRNAMISACRLVGFKMTIAKMSVFILQDGWDVDPSDRSPLVRITKGEPEYFEAFTRNANGQPDIRPRPRWAPGWESEVRVRWDAEQFSLQDVSNLMTRVGIQVGVGEGRPDSKNSAGMGWGTFDVVRIERCDAPEVEGASKKVRKAA